jgi:hypothetical protein
MDRDDAAVNLARAATSQRKQADPLDKLVLKAVQECSDPAAAEVGVVLLNHSPLPLNTVPLFAVHLAWQRKVSLCWC